MKGLLKTVICVTMIGVIGIVGLNGCGHTEMGAENDTQQTELEDFSVKQRGEQEADSDNTSDESIEDTEQIDWDQEQKDYYSISVHDCPMTVDGCTYTAEEGDGYNSFTCTKDGVEVFNISTISDNILSNGESYFYLNDDPSWIAIAKYDAEKQEWNNVFYEYDFDNYPHLVSYYNNKVYFIEGIVPGGDLCTYDQETEEKEVVLEETNYAEKHGDVLICGREYDASWSPGTLNSFNLTSGESTQICEMARAFKVISNSIYYVEYLHLTDEDSVGDALSDSVCNAYSCNLDGTNKKILFSEKRVPGGISEITESGIKVSQYNSDTEQYTYTEIPYDNQ